MNPYLLVAVAIGVAAPSMAAPIDVQSPWLRESAGAARTGAGYAVLRNAAAQPDRLLGARSAAAESVEVHSVTMDGGVTRMRPVRGGLPIPARGAVALKPGSYHLMLVGLKRPLRRGETVAIELQFANGKPMTVRFPVRPLGQEMADPDHAGH
jgi:copper(I)-binding protein